METERNQPIRHAPSVVISNLHPGIEGGRYPVKRVSGETLRVEADVFKDGHDEIRVLLKWRPTRGEGRNDDEWQSTPMHFVDNDRWAAEITPADLGSHEYTVEAWPDPFRSWKKDLRKRLDAGQKDLKLEVIEGAEILSAAAERAGIAGDSESAAQLSNCAETMLDVAADELTDLLFSDDLQAVLDYWPDRRLATVFSPAHPLVVERPRARFSAWYEFFPRSARGDGRTHAAFRDCLPRLDHAAAMGFDVVYLPPIHPIGITGRKGPNNTLNAGPDDPGSPWAIGGPAGGHYAVEPALGTIEDFEWLLGEAARRGLEIALDFAINCSPDHPYVAQHPDWFHQRPDGTIKYAENPPKKYQDIYPLNFHCDDWRALWREMRDIVFFWIERGVRIFRVDNPHTKPVSFWEYLIRDVREAHPDVILLSEAFTRPKMMQMLAKVGFSQGYTYFTWRVSKRELTDYVAELAHGGMRDYFRANFWPNTPDILAYHLHHAPPRMFELRALLAATLVPSWGIYSGYEFCENTPLGPEKEEYLDSEKFELGRRDWSAPGIRDFIGRLNRIRRENPALQELSNIRFIDCGNDHVLAFLKGGPADGNRLLVVANLDANAPQETTLRLPLHDLGLQPDAAFAVEDLLDGERYEWRGSEAYVRLDPAEKCAHVFRF